MSHNWRKKYDSLQNEFSDISYKFNTYVFGYMNEYNNNYKAMLNVLFCSIELRNMLNELHIIIHLLGEYV